MAKCMWGQTPAWWCTVCCSCERTDYPLTSLYFELRLSSPALACRVFISYDYAEDASKAIFALLFRGGAFQTIVDGFPLGRAGREIGCDPVVISGVGVVESLVERGCILGCG